MQWEEVQLYCGDFQSQQCSLTPQCFYQGASDKEHAYVTITLTLIFLCDTKVTGTCYHRSIITSLARLLPVQETRKLVHILC